MASLLQSVMQIFNKNPSPRLVSPLENLPLELLLDIVDFLPPASKTCLTLCSHSLLARIGRNSWLEIRQPSQRDTRVQFFHLLERNVPDILFCDFCEKVHKPALSCPVGKLLSTKSGLSKGSLKFPGASGVFFFQHAYMSLKVLVPFP